MTADRRPHVSRFFSTVLGTARALVLGATLDDHRPDAAHAVEVTEFVAQLSDLVDRSVTEHRFETPLPVVGVTRAQNDRLILVLDAVEFANHVVVAVIEREE